MHTIFSEITIIIVVSALLGFVARLLKQPTIVAYIGAGMIAGAIGLFHFDNIKVLEVLSTFGVTFLLFLVGLEMRVTEMKHIGRAALATGIGQIVFTSILGYVLARFLGFAPGSSFFMAIALTFSSTIIIVKLLSEKRDLNSLYGRIVVGFLLVQDAVAIVIIIILSTLNNGASHTFDLFQFLLVFLRGTLLCIGILWVGRRIMPKVIERIAHSQEMVFVTSIAWAVGLASLFASKYIGFSPEIGGLLAGLSLAHSSQEFQIASRIRPLRDFFIVFFFIILGSSLLVDFTPSLGLSSLTLSLFVLIGNPVIVMIIMGALGFRRRTSFLASLTVAQISEFSFIVIAMGVTAGFVLREAAVVVTIVGVVTILGSTYLVMYGDRLFRVLKPFLKVFERSHPTEKRYQPAVRENHIILIGANRFGSQFIPLLKEKRALVVDYDPTIVRSLESQGIHALYGDIGDEEIRDMAGIADADLVISAADDLEDNLHLVRHIRQAKQTANGHGPTSIILANLEWEMEVLYRAGADYVFMPHAVAGAYIRSFLSKKDIPKAVSELKKHQ